MRGDYGCTSILFRRQTGPPPRAWGLHEGRGRRRQHSISTPTCVGTTRRGKLGFRNLSVHPHVHGDYPRLKLFVNTPQGPPPRAWGLPPLCGSAVPLSRSTPTCVGTTETNPLRAPLPSVHPHVRGDYLYLIRYPIDCPGPPPRAWGLRIQPKTQASPSWSTPTCVGTTWGPPSRQPST